MKMGAIGGINKIKQNNGKYKYQTKQGWERKPVVYISFYDLCRYANWMHYGCPNTGKCTIKTTEGTAIQGAYDTSKFGTQSKKSIKEGIKELNILYQTETNDTKQLIMIQQYKVKINIIYIRPNHQHLQVSKKQIT